MAATRHLVVFNAVMSQKWLYEISCINCFGIGVHDLLPKQKHEIDDGQRAPGPGPGTWTEKDSWLFWISLRPCLLQ